jgi:hypothetical protein
MFRHRYWSSQILQLALLPIQSQNDDSSITVRPSSASTLLASTTVPLTRPRPANQHVPEAHTGPVSEQSNAITATLRPTRRTNFARLNTDDSDGIIDDDGTYSPPINLGKRERLSSIKEEHAGSRRTRPVRLINFKKKKRWLSVNILWYREPVLVSKILFLLRQVKWEQEDFFY